MEFRRRRQSLDSGFRGFTCPEEVCRGVVDAGVTVDVLQVEASLWLLSGGRDQRWVPLGGGEHGLPTQGFRVWGIRAQGFRG